MKRRYPMISAVAILSLGLFSGRLNAQPAGGGEGSGTAGKLPPPRELTCYVVMEEGASAEGNALFLREMGSDTEVMKNFAPSRFTRSSGTFIATVQGQLSFEAEAPILKGRSGALALYAIPVRLRADPPPAAERQIEVQFSLRDLASGRALIQPALYAMRLAATKAGMKSGLAWIVRMDFVAPRTIGATVGLAR